jgi:TolB protein
MWLYWLSAMMVLSSCLVILCRPCHAARAYIDINAPYLRKIPAAVPLFKNMGLQESDPQMGVTLANMLQDALDFTGFFTMLDRQSFLESPQEAGLTYNTINFQNWTAVGAELLFKGGFQLQGDILEMECRLFDTFGGSMLLGKRYTGRVEDQRYMIHRFCDEVILLLTGRQGIFTTKLAFVSTTTGNKEIYIADFDGHNPKQFTKSGAITLYPAWSFDGDWLAYTDYGGGKPNLVISQVNGSRRTVVSPKGTSITPAWMPGQFSLAASLSYEGNPRIYLLSGTGKIMKDLTKHWSIDVAPTWSPDGKSFAFVSDRSGSPQIYIKEVDSGNVRRLTFEGKYNTAPAWSPNGYHIAYAGSNDGHFDIFVTEVDGLKGPVQMTHEAGNNEAPSWSPDGTLIAFSSNREGQYKIYVMNANGSDQRRLLEMKGEQTNPSWSPRLGGD